MREYRVVLTPEALAFFESSRVDNRIKRIIRKKLDVLVKHPQMGKPLGGEFRGHRRLAVSYYRIIYRILETELVVDVIRIGLRRDNDVYRN